MQQDVATVGVNLTKNVFQIHRIAADTMVLAQRQFTRAKVLKVFSLPYLVGMEACASARHRSRELTALGHDGDCVRLKMRNHVLLPNSDVVLVNTVVHL